MSDAPAPAWCHGMAPARWYRVSGDAPDLGLPPTPVGTRYLVDNDPAVDPKLNPPRTFKERMRRAAGREPIAPWRGRVGFRAITEAWNSAVYAAKFGRCGSMVVFGGGHANYYGADVHAFDLENRTWQRVHDGWTEGAPADYGEGAFYPRACYPNGAPLPPHTYDYVQYDSAGNDLLLLKGQLELGPRVKATAIPHLFNLAEQCWRRGPEQPQAVLNSGGFSCWDVQRRVAWVHSGDDGGGNAFIAFAPDGDNGDGTFGRWDDLHANKLPGHANHNAMQWHPVLDVLVIAAHGRDALGLIDPEDAAAPVVWLESSGERPRLAPYAALQYAASTGALTYFSPRNGGALYALDAGVSDKARARSTCWQWRRLDDGVGPDPISDAERASHGAVQREHCFGRFRVATFADAELAMLVRHVDSAVYAIRLR